MLGFPYRNPKLMYNESIIPFIPPLIPPLITHAMQRLPWTLQRMRLRVARFSNQRILREKKAK
jgi:hypothetical protein